MDQLIWSYFSLIKGLKFNSWVSNCIIDGDHLFKDLVPMNKTSTHHLKIHICFFMLLIIPVAYLLASFLFFGRPLSSFPDIINTSSLQPSLNPLTRTWWHQPPQLSYGFLSPSFCCFSQTHFIRAQIKHSFVGVWTIGCDYNAHIS